MLETVRAMMWAGGMTFQYSHRLFRPHAFRWKRPRVEAIPSVLTRGWRAHPMAPWLSSPRLIVSDTGVVSSVSTRFPSCRVPPGYWGTSRPAGPNEHRQAVEIGRAHV